jgi:hypothetical protein
MVVSEAYLKFVDTDWTLNDDEVIGRFPVLTFSMSSEKKLIILHSQSETESHIPSISTLTHNTLDIL